MTPEAAATFIDLWQQGLTTDAIAQRLGHQGPRPQGLMFLNRRHCDGQRNLGRRINHEEHVPARDRDVDRVHPTPLILEAYLAGHLATAGITLRGVQIGAIGNTGHLRPKAPRLGQRPNGPEESGPQIKASCYVGILGRRR